MKEASQRRATVRSSLLLAAGLALGLRGAPAEACMHGVPSPQQDAMIFWNDNVEVLVWRATVEPPAAPGGRAAAAPAGGHPLAWVLAVPSAPLAYHTLNAEQFAQAHGWIAGQVSVTATRGGVEGAAGARGLQGHGLNVGPTQQVGNYQVTPLQGAGPAAVTALRGWLTQNHFGTPSDEALRAYAQQNATFLAVRSSLPANTPHAQLEPLAIAFRSSSIVVPVRLSGGAPPAELNVAVFSGRIPTLPQGPVGQGLEARPLRVIGGRLEDHRSGRVALVPWVSFPEVMRRVVQPLVPQVPQLEALLRGPVAAVYLSGQSVRIDASQPDPTLPLGEVVPANTQSDVR